MQVIINGDFLCRNLTGIERFAYETCVRLDALVPKGAVSICIPRNARRIPSFQNIQVFMSKRACTVFPVWEHITFSRFAAKRRALPLDFSNATPLFRPGIVFIHDIYAKTHPKDFSSRRERLMRLYMCAMYSHAARHAKKIITVSEFSRRQIAKIYRIPEERISVIYNGWEHFRTLKPDDGIFDRFPELTDRPYYFTLGSLQKRKNLAWIAEYAGKHPEELFVVSGAAISGLVSGALQRLQTLRNVVLPGFVSDGEIKALMQRCRAFVFPSYYEGFGIPPLEALSCGAPVVVSRSASLPELYGGCVRYIDAESADVDLEALLAEPAADPAPLLEKYSYQKAAEALRDIILAFA